MSSYPMTFNPCDECNYSYSKNNEVSSMCKICEFKQCLDLERQGRLIEQKHGQWYPMHFGGVWQCSECGYLTNDNKATRYCPDCGAKMS